MGSSAKPRIAHRGPVHLRVEAHLRPRDGHGALRPSPDDQSGSQHVGERVQRQRVPARLHPASRGTPPGRGAPCAVPPSHCASRKSSRPCSPSCTSTWASSGPSCRVAGATAPRPSSSATAIQGEHHALHRERRQACRPSAVPAASLLRAVGSRARAAIPVAWRAAPLPPVPRRGARGVGTARPRSACAQSGHTCTRAISSRGGPPSTGPCTVSGPSTTPPRQPSSHVSPNSTGPRRASSRGSTLARTHARPPLERTQSAAASSAAASSAALPRATIAPGRSIDRAVPRLDGLRGVFRAMASTRERLRASEPASGQASPQGQRT